MPDPTDPERVLLVERWASQEDLDAHMEVKELNLLPKTRWSRPNPDRSCAYDVTGERPIGN